MSDAVKRVSSKNEASVRNKILLAMTSNRKTQVVAIDLLVKELRYNIEMAIRLVSSTLESRKSDPINIQIYKTVKETLKK